MRVRQRIGLVWVVVGAALPFSAVTAFAAPARIDRDFGIDGIVSTPFPPQYNVQPFIELAATPVGGVTTRTGFYGSTEFRHYGPDGALTGVEAEVENGDELDLRPPEAATADGGRLVGVYTAGQSRNAVSRYRPDGSLDASFGSGGTSESLPLEVEAVGELPTGGALVAGKGVYQSGGTKGQPTYEVFVARLGADGKLDPGFGKGGIVKLHTEDGVATEAALHVQARGSGGAEVVTPWALVALAPSGGLDPSFGEDGRVATPGPAAGATAAGEMVLLAGTKPQTPSKRNRGASEDFYVARYDAAGKLDPTYAGGSGIGVIAADGEAVANATVFGSDGSVSIGGLATLGSANCPPGYLCDRTPVVVRFTTDGRPDGGFGEGGAARFSSLSVPYATDFLYGVEALAARPGGGLFVAGEGNGVTFLAALGADGSLDDTFGTGGLVTKTESESPTVVPVATGVDRAGDIFTLVHADSGTSLSEGAVVMRYAPDGKLDRDFGDEGKTFVPSWADGLTVTSEGSSYVFSWQTSTLTRLTPSGSLDPGFGMGGSVVFPPGEAFEAAAVVKRANGALLVGGRLTRRRGPWPAVIRYLPDGKLDRSFGKGGIAMVKPKWSGSWDVTSMAVDRRGRIVLAGSQLHGCCVEAGMLVRLDRDGGLDRSFGRGGFNLVGGRAETKIEGLVLRGDHILAVAGSGGEGSDRSLLYSFRDDGTLDHRFGDDGAAVVTWRQRRRGSGDAMSVFSTRRRLLVTRAGFDHPLVAFSPQGKPDRGFVRRLGGLLPRRPKYVDPVGPVAALHRGNLILTWSDHRPGGSERAKQVEVSLQRVLLGG